LKLHRHTPDDTKDNAEHPHDDSEVNQESWMRFVAQGLAAELSESRKNNYSIEDGEESAL
jgi:hypothetical protein